MKALAGMIALSVACLGVAGGILGLRHSTLAGIEAARSWPATPCVIERGAFVAGEDGRWLDLQYRYEVDGTAYTGDRLDLMPGSMGDDGSWEQDLLAQNPAGSTGTCWVDPEDPNQAVLDREHGKDAAGRLLVLAFPFGFIGAAFLYALVSSLISALRAKPEPAETARSTARGSLAEELGPAPRMIPLVARAAFLATTPGTVRLAWAFLVGFSLFFVILEGPTQFAELWPGEEVFVWAEITRVTPLDGHEFGRRVHEVEFSYEVDGQTHRGVSHVLGRPHEVGERAEVIHYPHALDAAHLANARRRFAPFWLTLIPFGVMALLALGIGGSYAFNLRIQPLLSRGEMAKPGSPQRFEIAGQAFEIDRRSVVNGAPEADQIAILYDAANPARNVALGPGERAILAGGGPAWNALVGNLVVPAVCLTAVLWLLFGVELSL